MAYYKSKLKDYLDENKETLIADLVGNELDDKTYAYKKGQLDMINKIINYCNERGRY